MLAFSVFISDLAEAGERGGVSLANNPIVSGGWEQPRLQIKNNDDLSEQLFRPRISDHIIF